MNRSMDEKVAHKTLCITSTLTIGLVLVTLSGAAFARQAQLAGRAGVQQSKGAEAVQIAGLRVAVWRPARTKHVPLVIFSHGFHGVSTQSAFLMKALAADGYLVMAPNHRDARAPGHGLVEPEARFGRPNEWSDATYKDRAEDITGLMKALKSDAQWSSAIEWSQVALMGHSLGGYTVLGLAGAWPAWKLAGVKAVVALSPYAAPFIERKSLGHLGMPVMYQGGTRDIGISPFLGKGGGAYDLTASPVYYIEFQGAGHLAWTDLVTQFQPSITSYCLAFLNKYVRADRTSDPSKRLSDVADLRIK